MNCLQMYSWHFKYLSKIQCLFLTDRLASAVSRQCIQQQQLYADIGHSIRQWDLLTFTKLLNMVFACLRRIVKLPRKTIYGHSLSNYNLKPQKATTKPRRQDASTSCPSFLSTSHVRKVWNLIARRRWKG